MLQPDDLTDIRDEIDNFIESIKQCYSEMDFDIYQNVDYIIQNGGHIEEEEQEVHIEDNKKLIEA